MFDKFKDMLKGFGIDEYEEDIYDESVDNEVESNNQDYYDFDDNDTFENYGNSKFSNSNKKYSTFEDEADDSNTSYEEFKFSKSTKTENRSNTKSNNKKSYESYMNTNQSNVKVQVVRPNKDDDWSKICDYLLDGCVIICNFEGIQPAIQHNIMYSLMGASYVMGAKCRYINPNIVVVVGKDVKLDGDLNKIISDSINNDGWEE